MIESEQPELKIRELRQELEELRARLAQLEAEPTGPPAVAVEEHERVGRALRQSEARYRVLFENSPVALWEVDASRLRAELESLRRSGVVDFRGYFLQRPEQALACLSLIRVVEVNRATLALYRASTKLHLKAQMGKLLVEAAYPAAIEVLESLAAGQTCFETEAVNGTFDGLEIEVGVRVQVAVGSEENLSRVFLAITDITKRKRTERVMQEVHSTLERRVVERTAALATAHEDLKSLLSIVSHDLRTPLINVKGFSGELRGATDELRLRLEPYLGQLGPEDRGAIARIVGEDLPEAIDFIDSSVNRINQFMETLLRLSQEGKRELHMERLDVEPLVREALKNLAFQIEQRQAQVIVGRLPALVADRISLEQILGNLLANAVLYLDPSRPGRIEVRGERSREHVIFHVEDNGRGIAADELPKVFAPFRRGRHQDVEGEGMGLAYVQALVRRHGGRIWCSSQEGVGSAFHFTLSARLMVDDARSTTEILLP
jgi:signal transduction histidine kinase